MKAIVSDEDIISAIRGGATKAHQLERRIGAHFRVIDRALQRCRKKGLIEHVNNRDGWRVVEQASVTFAAVHATGIDDETATKIVDGFVAALGGTQS